MKRTDSFRVIAVIATLAAGSLAALAQQAQNQGQQNQSQTQQNQQQNQQAQPQKKKSFWEKLKESAAQGTQNTVQQGSNAAQVAVQQGTNAAQAGAQQVQNSAQQGVQQGMQGTQQGAFPSNQGSGAFSGGGGGAGACGQSCFDAGPFQANVQQMTMSQQGAYHIIRMNIQFHNSTNQPLIIAYHDGSMVMVDNNGNTYVPAGGQPGQLQGMGIDRGNQTDSQFVLAPGQTGNALFSTARWRDNTSPVGTGYSYNFTIDELQAQNGAMAIPVRTYNLNFPTLAPGTSNATVFPTGSPTKGFTGGNAGTSYAGSSNAASAQGNTQVTGSPLQRGTAVPTTQQRMVNGRPAAPPSTAVNNAAVKSATTTTAKPSAAVKPIPTTTKKSTASTTQTNQANTTTTNK